MNKKDSKKIAIIIAIIVIFVIICICSIILTNKTKNGKENIPSNYPSEISDSIKITKIEDLKLVFNINRSINKELRSIYNESQKGGFYEMSSTHYMISQELHLKEAEKVFYIKDAYQAVLNEDITVYFAEGYTIFEDIDEITDGEIEGQKVKFTILKYKPNNNCYLDLYGTEYKETFNYNENIAETEVLKSAEEQGEEILDRDQDFLSNDLEKEVSNNDLAYWYYEDYKNNKLFSNQNKEEYNRKITKFTGNYNVGFTYTDNEGTNIFIKPVNIPMEYEVNSK